MIYFIELIFIPILIGTTYKKNKILSYVLVFLSLFVVFGLRSKYVGTDTYQWVNAYHTIGITPISSFESLRWENGYLAFSKLLYLINDDPRFLLIFTGIISSITISFFILKYSKDCKLSFFLLIATNTLFLFMNSLRELLALCIIVWALPLLKSKKYSVLFIFFCILSGFFHISGYVGLLLYFFYNLKVTNFRLILSFFGIVILFLFAQSIFSGIVMIIPRFQTYIDSQFSDGNTFGAVVQLMVYLVVVLFSLFVFKNSNMEYKNLSKFECLIIWSSIAFLALKAMSIKVYLFSRLSEIFVPFLILLLPWSLHYIKTKSDKYVYIFSIYTLFFGYFSIISYFRPEWYGCFPFEFWR